MSVCPRLYAWLCVPCYMSVCVSQAMEEVRQTLGTALQGHMTDVVVKAAQHEGADMVYFDDFLGNGDIGPDNKTKEVCEIYIYSTRSNLYISWLYLDAILSVLGNRMCTLS
jgi:hypothetical protein